MSNIIQVDSRENKNEHVVKQLEELGYKCITSKLYAGDYTLLHKQDVCIDRKKDMLEIANCICNSKEHIRFRSELQRAKDSGIKLFILIEDEKIYNIDGVKLFQSPRYKSNGKKNGISHKRGDKICSVNFETLGKAMKTMEEKYGCVFMFSKRENFGKKIIDILNNKGNYNG